MPIRTNTSEIMTTGVFFVNLDDIVKKADDLMKTEKIRHIPVVDGTKFVGLITERTLMEYSLRQLYDYDSSLSEIAYNKIIDYRSIMAKNVRIIYPEDSVLKAVELMTKYKTDCLPVVDWEHNLKGIITSVDIMLFFYKNLKEEYEKVEKNRII